MAGVFALLRDHFEGTEFDMTQGVDAGPYGLPNRWRPLAWKVDGTRVRLGTPHCHTADGLCLRLAVAGLAARSRGRRLLVWSGRRLYFLLHSALLRHRCRAQELQRRFEPKFSWDSAWWVFNFVSNYACLKWSHMAPEIQACQKDIESNFLALQPAVEKTAVELLKTNPDLAIRYLTDYSVMHGDQTVGRWRELAEHLIKYNDGYVRDAHGAYPEVGYPEAWLRRVLKERPEQFKVPEDKAAGKEKK